MITGPGDAATTRTSTPKSRSFFSISRDVISSDSGVTLDSTRPGAASSKSTCGSLVSLSSANSGFCRSFAMRVDFGTSARVGSMTIGAWSSATCRSTSSPLARSFSATSPSRMSSARLDAFLLLRAQ